MQRFRKLVNIIKSGKIAIARSLRSLPVDAPAKFINNFVFAYNSHDLNEYKQRFLSMCVPELRVIKRIYGKVDPLTGKPRNPLGNFSYLEINGINQVLYMADRFFQAAPDGILETGTHRSCNTNKATVLVSTFKFRGTLIEEMPTNQIESSSIPPTADAVDIETTEIGGELVPLVKRSRPNPSPLGAQYPSSESESDIGGVVSGAGIFQTKTIHSVGSLAMYLNDEGKVYCLEFFYEYL